MTGCADALARVWTAKQELQAPEQERAAYQQAVAAYQKASEFPIVHMHPSDMKSCAWHRLF